MELIDNETLFNPTSEKVGSKVLWAINNGYDILIEKSDEEFVIRLTVMKRKNLIDGYEKKKPSSDKIFFNSYWRQG